MSNKNAKSFSAKGYYIALILCAVAIGICGYLYYQNAQDGEEQLANPDMTVNGDVDLPVGITNPTVPSGEEAQTQPTQPSVTHKAIKTTAPVSGQVVAAYAMDSLSYNPTTRDWRVHNGVDYAAEAGTKVCAAADGTVYTVYTDETMGTTVVISHEGGYTTTYASLMAEVNVKAGQTVTVGQNIGSVGNTALMESAIGDHVHFSVKHNDTPMDPAEFLAME